MKKKNKPLSIYNVFIRKIFSSISVYTPNIKGEVNNLLEDQTAKIEKFIEENIKKGKIPGLSVVIVKDRETLYQRGFGYANIKTKQQVVSKTLFEIGSNSKAFTGLAILKLQEDGLINLKDESTKYIPWLKVLYKGREVDVTIEQFMNHTSGIPFKTIDKIPVSNEVDALEKTVRTLQNLKLDSIPGEKFQYATINYDVLGLIIEKVSGTTYEEYMKNNILKSIGLENTYLSRENVGKEDIAQGYKLAYLKPRLYDAPIYRGNTPAGYIISNAEDMAKWLKIQMDFLEDLKIDNKIIDESYGINNKKENFRSNFQYESGWVISGQDKLKASHGGRNPNYSSYVVFNPKDKVGIIVLSNINSSYTELIGEGINEILQGKEFQKGIKDLNHSADIISIVSICIMVVINLIILYLVVSNLKDIQLEGIKIDVTSILSLTFMIGLSNCIYMIPNILYKGLSWKFVFVWLPKSVKAALYLTYISIWLIYILCLIYIY